MANYNSPGQTVIAGHKAAIDRAVALAKERGARKATLLAVSAPVPLAADAPRPARAWPGRSAETRFRDPAVPVVSQRGRAPGDSPGDDARDALVRQIDSPVRWVESVRWMADKAGRETCSWRSGRATCCSA